MIFGSITKKNAQFQWPGKDLSLRRYLGHGFGCEIQS